MFQSIRSVIASLVLIALLGPARAGDYDVAIIIGNQNYAARGFGVSDVDYALNDAAAFKALATGPLEVPEGNVVMIENASSGDLNDVFGNSFSAEGNLHFLVRRGRSTVYVFYSGHGMPNPLRPTESAGYLLPVNGRADRPQLNGYPLELLVENLGKLPAKRVVLFIDACFSGLSGDGVPLTSGVAAVAQAPVAPTATVSVLSATSNLRPEFASWLPEEKHGAFTYYLVTAFGGAADKDAYGQADSMITLEEVAAYLADEMSYQVGRKYHRTQTPTLRGPGSFAIAALQPKPVVEPPAVGIPKSAPRQADDSPPPNQAISKNGDGAQTQAVLYEEAVGDEQSGSALSGSVKWTMEQKSFAGGEAQTIISASATIPEHNMAVAITLRENSDPQLPATHLLEIEFEVPSAFEGGGVENVPGVIMKVEERARGDALRGVSAQAAPNLFWIALGADDDDRSHNIDLIAHREWLDIPILYKSGRRAILTLRKGTGGKLAVDAALREWSST